MTIGERIRDLRTAAHMTQDELGAKVGVQKQTIYKYEAGLVVNLKRDVIGKLAKALNVAPSYLMGFSDDAPTQQETQNRTVEIPDGFLPIPHMVKKPRLGVIACGEPIMAEENFDGYDDVPDYIRCDFTLKCKGDSMVGARINDGDIVYIRQQPDVENGQIAAVMEDGEKTLKRVYKYPNKVILQPENPKYPPIVYVGEELNAFRILGKAVGFTSMIK
jgi:repressor LexA